MNKKYFFYFSLVMCVAYVAFGILIIFFDTAIQVNKSMKVFFGVAIILYGIFRSIRSYQLVRGKSNNELK